jgi:3-phosphoglycerate kinase
MASETVQILLDHGADVNLEAHLNRCSALFLACRSPTEHIKTIKLLLKHDAKVNIVVDHL